MLGTNDTVYWKCLIVIYQSPKPDQFAELQKRVRQNDTVKAWKSYKT